MSQQAILDAMRPLLTVARVVAEPSRRRFSVAAALSRPPGAPWRPWSCGRADHSGVLSCYQAARPGVNARHVADSGHYSAAGSLNAKNVANTSRDKSRGTYLSGRRSTRWGRRHGSPAICVSGWAPMTAPPARRAPAR